MSIIHKLSSGAQSGDGIIFASPCFYYGFTCATGGTDRTTILYDNASAASGKKVEHFVCDGNKTEDGHSHAIPVYCTNGLYLDHGGGTVIVFFKPFRTPPD